MIRWPGKVPAGVVTDEMLAASDWLPTLAGMADASDLVPKDRPIDGIDASVFMLGKNTTTGRDTFMFFGPDGELMSVKWKICKAIFRCSEGGASARSWNEWWRLRRSIGSAAAPKEPCSHHAGGEPDTSS